MCMEVGLEAEILSKCRTFRRVFEEISYFHEMDNIIVTRLSTFIGVHGRG